MEHADLVNWKKKKKKKKKNPAFPLEKMPGHWVAIRPFLDVFFAPPRRRNAPMTAGQVAALDLRC